MQGQTLASQQVGSQAGNKQNNLELATVQLIEERRQELASQSAELVAFGLCFLTEDLA